jgi:hypothetical protein
MRIRFSISNLLLLTALVGVLIAWYLDNRRLSNTVRELTDLLNQPSEEGKLLVNDAIMRARGEIAFATRLQQDNNLSQDTKDEIARRIRILQTSMSQFQKMQQSLPPRMPPIVQK